MNRSVAAVLSLIVVAVSSSGAQTKFTPPRAGDGRPNFEGIWDFRTQIPLERPKEMGTREFLTPKEISDLRAKKARSSLRGDDAAPVADEQRTSLIIDPPDGRLPALRPGVPMQVGAIEKDLPATRPYRVRGAGMSGDNPEDRGISERCLVGFNSGPPIVPGYNNQNIQIVQTRDYIVIVNEMVHDARIVPLDGRPHLPGHIRQWMGDGRGHWEGDTVVIETTNFTDKTATFQPVITQAIGSGATLHLTERFRLVASDLLQYEYTVNDPATFTRPFTVLVPMRRGLAMFEYACHEGNRAMEYILQAGRFRDAAK